MYCVSCRIEHQSTIGVPVPSSSSEATTIAAGPPRSRPFQGGQRNWPSVWPSGTGRTRGGDQVGGEGMQIGGQGRLQRDAVRGGGQRHGHGQGQFAAQPRARHRAADAARRRGSSTGTAALRRDSSAISGGAAPRRGALGDRVEGRPVVRFGGAPGGGEQRGVDRAGALRAARAPASATSEARSVMKPASTAYSMPWL